MYAHRRRRCTSGVYSVLLFVRVHSPHREDIIYRSQSIKLSIDSMDIFLLLLFRSGCLSIFQQCFWLDRLKHDTFWYNDDDNRIHLKKRLQQAQRADIEKKNFSIRPLYCSVCICSSSSSTMGSVPNAILWPSMQAATCNSTHTPRDTNVCSCTEYVCGVWFAIHANALQWPQPCHSILERLFFKDKFGCMCQPGIGYMLRLYYISWYLLLLLLLSLCPVVVRWYVNVFREHEWMVAAACVPHYMHSSLWRNARTYSNMAHIDVGSMVARIGNDGAGRFDGGGAAVMMQSQADDASIAPCHATLGSAGFIDRYCHDSVDAQYFCGGRMTVSHHNTQQISAKLHTPNCMLQNGTVQCIQKTTKTAISIYDNLARAFPTSCHCILSAQAKGAVPCLFPQTRCHFSSTQRQNDKLDLGTHDMNWKRQQQRIENILSWAKYALPKWRNVASKQRRWDARNIYK